MNGDIGNNLKLYNGSEDNNNKMSEMDANDTEKGRNRVSYCSSPIGSNSQIIINQTDNELRSSSLSPLFQNIQKFVLLLILLN